MLTAEITTSKRLFDKSSIMVSNFVVTTFTCRPMFLATAVMRSTSKPAALLVAVSIYSCGGYVVSLPTVNTPGTFKSSPEELVPVVDDVEPQAASSTVSITNTPASSILGDLRRADLLVVNSTWVTYFNE